MGNRPIEGRKTVPEQATSQGAALEKWIGQKNSECEICVWMRNRECLQNKTREMFIPFLQRLLDF